MKWIHWPKDPNSVNAKYIPNVVSSKDVGVLSKGTEVGGLMADEEFGSNVPPLAKDASWVAKDGGEDAPKLVTAFCWVGVIWVAEAWLKNGTGGEGNWWRISIDGMPWLFCKKITDITYFVFFSINIWIIIYQ